ncbi:MAG: hypothetical protein IKH76_05870 [Clostridiales bacterium]|nr:hypothetical protein [Clostridiales bacterium]
MLKYPDAAKGVGRIFVSEIMALWIAVSALVLLIAALVVLAFEDISEEIIIRWIRTGESIHLTPALIVLIVAGSTLIISAIAAVVLLVSGLTRAAKDEKLFKLSFLFLIIAVLSAIAEFIFSRFAPFVADGISVLFLISRFLITYYVLMGINNLAVKLDRNDVSRIALRCRNLICFTYIVVACVTFLSALIQNNIGIMIVNSVIGINLLLDIVCYFIYLVALRRAKKMLKLAKE